MATTKRSRATTSTRKSSSTATRSEPSLATRTGRSIKSRPYASAAAVAAVGLAAAGAWLFKKRGKTIEETTDELKVLVKDGLDEARTTAKSVRAKASKAVKSAREAVSERMNTDERSQREIAEEALSLKDSATPAEHPLDETVQNQTKAGAIAY